MKKQKKKAIQLLTSYVDLQPHAIEMKSRIILDHFLEKTANSIRGRGRAMVVTRSRLHAVKYYLMFKKLMTDKFLPFKPLVAFSGTVKDPDTGDEHTEISLNRLPSKVSITDAFKTLEYRILVVAEKFQTGFDEPFLHTMYVDKKLGGVNAVQTLSRLNRTISGKSETFVLDFVNEAEDIQKSFQPYYQTTFLEEETDPNKLYDLQSELEQFGIYTREDVKEFAAVFFNPQEKPEKLQPILDRVVNAWKYIVDEDKQEDFRSTLQRFIRLYGFVSQLITFEDVELDSFRIQETFKGYLPLVKDNSGVPSITGGRPQHEEGEKDLLSNIIKTLNETHGLNLTEGDKVDIERMKFKLEENEELQAVMNENNTLENIRYKFDKVVDSLLLDFVNTKIDLYKKLTDPNVNAMFKQKWFDGYVLQTI